MLAPEHAVRRIEPGDKEEARRRDIERQQKEIRSIATQNLY
jgi:hypothetical protein